MIKSLLFPGQGSQKVGMGKELFENFNDAKYIFQNIDDSLSQNLSKIIFEGPEEQLTLTENAQPAIMAVSIAILEVLRKEFGFELKDINYCAGHSLGEYTALAATSALDIRDVAKLLKVRGLSMQEALAPGKGAMAALIGVKISQAKEMLKELSSDYICEIANHNSENQIVLSGDTAAIDEITYISKKNNVKAIKLKVSAPFHCQYMRKTADKLEEIFRELKFSNPTIPIVCNYTANVPDDLEDMKNSLLKQTYSTVLWYDTICYMIDNKVDSFIEIGNGSTLSGIIKRMKIEKNINTTSISSKEDITNYMKL